MCPPSRLCSLHSVTLRYTMVLWFARNILPESKRHDSKYLKKTNSNSAPLLKLLHLKHELFLFVLQSTRKMMGFKQTSNNSRNTVDMIRTNMEILFQSPCEVFLFNTYPYCSWNDTVYSSRRDKQVVEDSKIEAKNNCWNFHTPVEHWKGYYHVTQLSLS